jgi:regulatory protein
VAADRDKIRNFRPEDLQKVALSYLNRLDSSVGNLRRVLQRWARKHAAEDADLEGAQPLIEQLLERYQGSGLLDDLRFAKALAAGQRRRGASRRLIELRLRARLVPTSLIDRAISEVDSESGDGELAAAREFVRKRRIGPHRAEPDRTANCRKDFAALARAGFSADTARTALGAELDDSDLF